MTTDNRFDNYRSMPAFTNNDDSLIDLSDDELADIFRDLGQRCAAALADALDDLSDSFLDDTLILTTMILTATKIAYGDNQTKSPYDAFFDELDAGLIQDLTDLRDSGTAFNYNHHIAPATIWLHINTDALDND